METNERISRLRRTYEIGRLWSGVWRASLVAMGLMFAMWLRFDSIVWSFCLVPFLVLGFTEWVGQDVMRGARRGAIGGLVPTLVPAVVLRPCCGVDGMMTAASCCTMPSVCTALGAVLGLAVAWTASGKRASHATYAGVALGAMSVAFVRCGGLFLGEALGLLGGLAAGVISLAAGRMVFARIRA